MAQSVIPSRTYAEGHLLWVAQEKEVTCVGCRHYTLRRTRFAPCGGGEIARRAGISKSSLYNSFRSQDDLFLHVCSLGVHAFRESVSQTIPFDWEIYGQGEELFRRNEFLEVEEELNRKKMEAHLERVIRFIHPLFRPSDPRSETDRQGGIHVRRFKR